MSKTVVYIDVQNFSYAVAEYLLKSGIISDKQEVVSVDIPFLMECALGNDASNIDEIRYYGVSKIKRQTESGERMLDKSIRFAENLRKFKNSLQKSGIKYVSCGQLRPREVDACKRCGYEDYKFQEKGVDVGLAVDIVKDVLTNEVNHVILVSSDTDLVPAIRVTKEREAKMTYIAFDKMIIRPLSVLANTTVVLRGYEIAEAYANSLK